MPYHFEFDPANRILNCRFEGRVTDKDLKEFYRICPKYIGHSAPSCDLVDMTAVTSFEGSAKTMIELAELPPLTADVNTPCFVVAPSPHIFGLMRMFQIRGETTRPNLHVVGTQEEVWRFLGIRKPSFEPIADNLL